MKKSYCNISPSQNSNLGFFLKIVTVFLLIKTFFSARMLNIKTATSVFFMNSLIGGTHEAFKN